MDKSLAVMLIFSLVLVSTTAPYAMATLGIILTLVSLCIWGAWAVLQGFGRRQPQAERVWD